MSPPLVLLALADDPVAHALHATLLDHTPRLEVRRCAERAEIVDACATEGVNLLIVSHRLDDTAGAALLRELGVFGSIPQAIVLFDDAGDARRAVVAQAGALDHVLPPQGELQALVALVDRVISKNVLEARLDQASRQFRVLVDNSNDGIYIVREGRFVYTNRRFQRMVGYSAEELVADELDITRDMVAPESRPMLAERARRVSAGQPVEPRYEFVALRKDGDRFDAQVSISYIDLEDTRQSKVGGALGIMQDITERKRFESKLVRKNRELALLNDLATSINQAVALDETLTRGCQQLRALLDADAAGIALLSPTGATLELRFSEGLDEDVRAAIERVPLKDESLLTHAVRSGELVIVEDLARDPRVAFDAVKASRFGCCLVVPLKTRSQDEGEHRRDDVLGAAFVFLARGRSPAPEDRDLMISIGTLLGNAVEKVSLLEAQRAAVQKLVALDEIAVALASTLDVNDVALTVARSVHRLFGATHVLIGRLADDRRTFVPMHVLDGGRSAASDPVPWESSIMGLCIEERTPVQRVRPPGNAAVDGASIDPYTGKPVALLPFEREQFQRGVGTGVAVPVMQDGEPVGAMWIGYAAAEALSEQALQVLSSIGMHVAIATKNAALFAARNAALDDLRAAQTKLVESEKLNAIGLIAHGVAHDFNNVLGAILGRVQLLKSQLRDPQLLKHAEIIEKAATDGAETVRRIQEIGRQDKSEDFVPVDLDQVITDVAELTHAKWSRADAPAIELALERVGDSSPEGGPPMVAGNPHQLREVLINLVHNAVDAMPDGGHIVLSTHRMADTGTCEVRIRDTGTGMPPEIVHRIFDPYFTTKGERGTGLGLSVSLSIVRRHGGEVDVIINMSGPQRGITFGRSFPGYVAPEVEAPVRPSTTSTEGAGRARILVVDDEENIREVLAEILMSGDHEVVTAVDGPEALACIRDSEPFDLVFTDLGLPGMNGYQVASEIKKLRPGLPVGLVTGWGATLDTENARAQGVDLIISKPFRFDQVLTLVEEALAMRAPRAPAS